MIDLSMVAGGGFVGKLLRLPLRLVPKDAVVPILQGPLFGRWWVAGSSVHGCWLGWYERDKQVEFARSVRPGSVVYDIGANVGFYTLLSSVLVGPRGRVFAFEPVPRNLEFLRRHIRLNRLGNVAVLELAVGEKMGEATFDDTLGTSQGKLSSGGRLRVQVAAIDDLVSSGVVRPPDALKIDVEGAEAAVLRGAMATLQRHHPAIFLATHGPAEPADCLELLRGIGYRVAAVGGGAPDGTDEVLATFVAGGVTGS